MKQAAHMSAGAGTTLSIPSTERCPRLSAPMNSRTASTSWEEAMSSRLVDMSTP